MFWPPAVILLVALAASIVDFDDFLAFASRINDWILLRLGPLIGVAAFGAVLLIGAVFISPLGGVRIGGAAAKPVLRRWHWFAITLCTTIATGILFWGTAEPIYHLNAPPDFAHAEPRTGAASEFALSTLYMHWAITPYCLYAVPALAFALSYHNLKSAYSLSGPLGLSMGPLAKGTGAAIIDAAALFALVAGVAASLGAGVMTLVGGVVDRTPLSDGPLIRLIVTAVIVATYVVSSVSGLQRGIKVLSDINIRIFFALVLFVFIAGPTLHIIRLAFSSAGEYGAEFVPRSIGLIVGGDGEWKRDWTTFYFANWLAWAPITALFLGRIAVGYSVREFIIFTMALPALFGMTWMAIFGGAAIDADLQGGALTAALDEEGPEAVAYALFNLLPLSGVVIAAFLFTTFISFVTAMDSNTHSIASVCLDWRTQGDEPRGAGLSIKIFWGVLIGAVAFVMTATNGVDGVRMLSNLGGAPGLLIIAGCAAALVRLAMMGPSRLE
ncbi:MAG TPA: BCCT family transporter [Parvularculaceae bacterium]|nr:BCCT family transporter [Parvularculaceae bacterium]